MEDGSSPTAPKPLSPAQVTRLAKALLRSGFAAVAQAETAEARLSAWRWLYSPIALRLARHLNVDLPMLRAYAWNQGVVLLPEDGAACARTKTRPLRDYPELHVLPPLAD